MSHVHSRNISPTCETIFNRCQGAYSDKTLSGYRNDLQRYIRWCDAQGREWMPSSPDCVANFIDDQIAHYATSTLRRSIVAIKFAHIMLEQPFPHSHPDIDLALRRAARRKAIRPKQSLGLTHELLDAMITKAPDTLAGKRDRTLVSLGYDTLCRSREIAMIEIEHLSEDLGSVLIPFAKNDALGVGRIAYLSPRTQRFVAEWLEQSGIATGALFQGLHTHRPSGTFLDTSSIRRIIKRLAAKADLKQAEVENLSGHSMRIGAAQDMMRIGFDHLAIMQAGGWKCINVLARYVENASTKNLHEARWNQFSSVQHD